LRGARAPLRHSWRRQCWGQTPQPIFTQNGLIDVDSRKDVPFVVKNLSVEILNSKENYSIPLNSTLLNQHSTTIKIKKIKFKQTTLPEPEMFHHGLQLKVHFLPGN